MQEYFQGDYYTKNIKVIKIDIVLYSRHVYCVHPISDYCMYISKADLNIIHLVIISADGCVMKFFTHPHWGITRI